VTALDPRAVAVGALVIVAVALPLALADAAQRGDDARGDLTLVVFVVTLGAFVAGGYLAARRAPTSPYSNGAVAALAGFAVVSVLGVLSRAARGEAVSVTRIVFSGLLAYACGLLGGGLASRLAARGTSR
jgi:putative membrane protein (TIGR04086 family)